MLKRLTRLALTLAIMLTLCMGILPSGAFADGSQPPAEAAWFTLANVKAAGPFTDDNLAQAVYTSVLKELNDTTHPGFRHISNKLINPYNWRYSTYPADCGFDPSYVPEKAITSYASLMEYINAKGTTDAVKTKLLLQWYPGDINAKGKNITNIEGITVLQDAYSIDLSKNLIESLAPLAATDITKPITSGNYNLASNPIHVYPAFLTNSVWAQTHSFSTNLTVLSPNALRYRYGDSATATIFLDVTNASGIPYIWNVRSCSPAGSITDTNQTEATINTIQNNKMWLSVQLVQPQGDDANTNTICTYYSPNYRDGSIWYKRNVQHNTMSYDYSLPVRLYAAVKQEGATEFFGGFGFTKTDKDNDSIKLAGATYKLFDKDGKQVTQYVSGLDTTSGEKVYSSLALTTGADGSFVATGLPAGDYTLVEVTAPVGYEADATPIPITIPVVNPTVYTTMVGGISSFSRSSLTPKMTPDWDNIINHDSLRIRGILTDPKTKWEATANGFDTLLVNQTETVYVGFDEIPESLGVDDTNDYALLTHMKNELKTPGTPAKYTEYSHLTVTMTSAQDSTKNEETYTTLLSAMEGINDLAEYDQLNGDIVVDGTTLYISSVDDIKENNSNYTQGNKQKPTPPPDTTTTTNPPPRTGDAAPILLLGILCVLSAFGICAVMPRRRTNK